MCLYEIFPSRRRIKEVMQPSSYDVSVGVFLFVKI